MKYLKKFREEIEVGNQGFRIICQRQLKFLGIDEEDLQYILQDLIDEIGYHSNITCNQYFGDPEKPETIVKWKGSVPRDDVFRINVYHHGKGLEFYDNLKDEYFNEIDSRLSDHGLKIVEVKKHIDNPGGSDSFHILVGRI